MKKYSLLILNLGRRFYKRPYGPYLLGVAVIAGYLLTVQHVFVFSGDIWAETFAEYVEEAVRLGWLNVIQPSWAGYLTIIPSFFSKSYVALGLPLGYIDLYLRAVSLVFLSLCLGFIAHPINRKLIRQDWLRLVIALLTLLAVRHISALSFINIWYAGFVIVALVSLSGLRLARRWQIAYTIFAVLISLSKSSPVLLPFAVYRLLKTRQYVQNGLIILAIGFQTYLTVFAKNGYGDGHLTVGILDIVRDLFLSVPVMTLKIVHLTPGNPYLIVLLSLLLIAGVTYLWHRQKRLAELLTVASSLGLSLYLHIFAPDHSFKNLWYHSAALSADTYKVQREFFIYFLLLLLLAVAVSPLIARSRMYKWRRAGIFVLVGAILLLANPLRPIDSSSPAVHTSINAYRYSLDHQVSVCVPVPPTPLWEYKAIWFYQYRGGCYLKTKPQPIDLTRPGQALSSQPTLLTSATTPQDELKTVMVLIRKPAHSRVVVLLDSADGKDHFSAVSKSSDSTFDFLSFNVAGIGPASARYDFKLRTEVAQPGISVVDFKRSSKPVVYYYFMGYPNYQ